MIGIERFSDQLKEIRIMCCNFSQSRSMQGRVSSWMESLLKYHSYTGVEEIGIGILLVSMSVSARY